jgi:hypothetical protein
MEEGGADPSISSVLDRKVGRKENLVMGNIMITISSEAEYPPPLPDAPAVGIETSDVAGNRKAVTPQRCMD